MTNAPADLLGLRGVLMVLLGLSAVEVGIVGDGAHQGTGGYHEGEDTLVANGLWSGDYSVRLARDRAGATNSSSAVDLGAAWQQGRAAWIRWNGLLVAALHNNDVALAAIRAVNYSPDGTLKRRTDREAGWSVVSTTDTVDIHTHIEWYRDTEGKRQASLDRLADLVRQAIGVPLEDDMTPEEHNKLDAIFNLYPQVPGLDPTNPTKKFDVPITKALTSLTTQVAGLVAAVKGVNPGFTDAQVTAIAGSLASTLAASPNNGLTAGDHAGIQADLQVALAAELKKISGAA